MRILSHYFATRFLGFVLTVLASGLAILATIELVLNLEEMSALSDALRKSGSSAVAGTLLSFLWNRLATLYLPDLIPIASFVAAFLTVAVAGRRLEWIAIEANGIRPLRVLLPVMASAGLIAIAAHVVDETIVLRARRAHLVEDRFDREEIALDRRAFWYHRGPIITNIGHADPTTRTLHDVELFERGLGEASGRIARIVRAPDVRILSDGRWHFDEASVWTFDPADPVAEPRFETRRSLELDLESVPRNPLAEADPVYAPLATLARHVAAETPKASPNARRLALAYYERLSRPVRVVVLGWLALPFGLLVDRRGRIAPAALLGLVALATYFGASTLGAALTRLSLLPIGLSSWAVPLLFAMASGIGLLRRRV
ncbi:MAG: LptF/LptG family permease [Myxococcota bacterium]